MPLIPKGRRLDLLIVDQQTDFNDDGPNRVPGLALRVTPAGTRSWVVMARRPGKSAPSRFKLGDLRDLALSEARAAALSFKAQLRDGVDPIAERDKRRGEAGQSLADRESRSLRSLGALFQERHVASLRPSTREDYDRVVRRMAELWGDRACDEVSRADLIEWLDRETDRAPASARLSYAILHRLFAFGVERGRLVANPLADVRAPAVPRSRDRWLNDAEITAFWLATDAMASVFASALQFLLVTGQRRDEVSAMTWSEIDLERSVWTIPSEKAKNGRAHEVDLPPLAVEIVMAQPRIGSYVFGGGPRPVSGWSKGKARVDAIIEGQGARMPPWRVHDLRRTMASHMAEMGTHPIVIEKILNHASGAAGGLTAVYQRSERRTERKAALMMWDAKLQSLIGRQIEDNVVSLR